MIDRHGFKARLFTGQGYMFTRQGGIPWGHWCYLRLATNILARRKDTVSFKIWTEQRATVLFIYVERSYYVVNGIDHAELFGGIKLWHKLLSRVVSHIILEVTQSHYANLGISKQGIRKFVRFLCYYYSFISFLRLYSAV